jgi:hypothetical protein
MISERQTEANQVNAQKSTGPNDTSNTRFNAFKHGLCSEIKFCQLHEKWYTETLNAFRMQFKPNNFLEESLIQKMALSWLRMNKALDTENQLYSKEVRKAKYFDIIDEEMEVKPKGSESPKSYYIPLTADNELIQRYEASAERSFYRALEKLQELRGKNGFVSQKQELEVREIDE